MARTFCNREDCCYHSLGGWCQLGHHRWERQTDGTEVDCRLIRSFRQLQSQSDRRPV